MTTEVSWLFPKRPLDTEEIKSIEQQLGIIFPKDYVDCVKQNNGGQPDPDTFYVGDREAVFSSLIPLNQEESRNVLTVKRKLAERLPEGVVPFADDPFGNYLCFDYRRNQEPKIGIWDHERGVSDKEKALTLICDTFTELVGMLTKSDSEHM
ncbi:MULTISPECIES: SMI1/KNR4 family protein [Brevibacillus]|uniref:SMI1/KNR4 family protein n=1 Tax=Brevibacillus TaxID=55080 RepID=UPI0031593F75